MARLRPYFLVAFLISVTGSQDVWPDDSVDVECEGSSLLQTKTETFATSSNSLQPALLEIVPVENITARGSRMGPDSHELTPDQYTLSKTASEFGYNKHNALMDGGGEEWKLFPEGKVPQELAGDAGHEFMQTNDPGDHCSPGDVAGYSILNVSEPTLVTFIVPKGQKNRKDAAVIVAPGGGFRFLSWNKEGTEIAKWLNTLGISAFVLKYRVPCNTMETAMKALCDAQRAISMVRSKNLGFKKIGVAGFSAGGFLAASVSSFPTKVYAPIDDVDKHSSSVDFAVLVYAAGKDGTTFPAQAPATFIALAKDDPCVKVSLAESYYSKLRKYSPEHELHIFGGGHHGYGDCQLYVTGNEWQPVCAWTIDAQFFMETPMRQPLSSPLTLLSSICLLG
jgi:acetyl esterase/lipase